jgi:hypothetical protein
MKSFIQKLVIIIAGNAWAGQPSIYTPDCFIKPCEIKSDFDGDGKSDRAILVKDKNGKKGIEFRFANKKTIVIGAGKSIGNGGDDFSWMDHWETQEGAIKQGASGTRAPRAKGTSRIGIFKPIFYLRSRYRPILLG